jgi:Tfp pilus tip-associated adhesin PilY1
MRKHGKARHFTPLRVRRLVISALIPALALTAAPSGAFDTDIFAGLEAGGPAPNVLIVLDNTSNWSRQSQHWPGGIQQGQAEADAIRQVIQTLPGRVNVGLLEFVTGGPATDNGGFVRYAISPMGQGQGATAAADITAFSNTLTTIYSNINSPQEKTNSREAYGNLMYDVYNYFAGATPYAASGDVVASLADSNGYAHNYSLFRSPLSTGTSCATNYIIFIGNPDSSGPASDGASNTNALQSLGGSTGELPLPVYTSTTQNTSTNLGYSSACYASAPTGTPTDYTSLCPPSASYYNSCTYSSTDNTTALPSCAAGTTRYSVIASKPNSTTSQLGTTSACFASVPTSFSDPWFSACSSSGNSCSANTPGLAISASCPSGTQRYMVQDVVSTTGTPTTSTAYTNQCYQNANGWNSSDHGSLTCPAASGNTTYSCTYSAGNPSSSSGCSGGKKKLTVTQTATPTTTTTTNKGYTLACTSSSSLASTSGYSCTGTCQINAGNTSTGTLSCPAGTSAYTVKDVVGTSGTTTTNLGNTFACYSSLSSCSTSDYSCPPGATCACNNPTTTTGVCPAGARYQVLGNGTVTTETPTGAFTTDTSQLNADEWSRFLHQTGVPVPPGQSSTFQTVSTYTIDVFNAHPNATQTSLLASMARAGGGKYFTAMNEQAIISALQSIFAEILSVNSDFASASLPISTSNRAQSDNQVYIGVFRPDATDHPRWYGNLKRFQLANLNGYTDLADVNGNAAVSSTTGFLTPCATSWWTTDSGSYWYDVLNNQSRIFITQATSPGTAWQTVGDDTDFAKSLCGTSNLWSDLPDGQAVEKGAVAEVLRQQSSRTVKTLSSANALVDFNTTNVTSLSSNSTINANIVDFIRGQDVTGEIAGTPSTGARASIHGDVVHSRPLPVDYGGSTGVYVFYGANDGTFRAVRSSDGSESWSFVAPETFGNLQRLMDNTPLIQTPSPTPPGGVAIPGATPKQFFFDGTTGLYQNANNSSVWIYPSMRRGGRMLYAFDVTTPNSPQFKWKAGCPDQTDDVGCSSGMTGIGQTWSAPGVAFLGGYSSTTPAVIVGGGYDTCEDTDSATTSCSSPKGATVYVLDANSGAIIKSFTTTRSVAAEVALVDINGDGSVDAAYVADTGGNLYRINFSDPTNYFAALPPTSWTITKVAYTSAASRKFLFTPAVVPYKNSVYVALGSGDPEHPLSVSYPYTTPVTNRFYVYLDNPLSSTVTNLDGATMLNYTNPSTNSCATAAVLPSGSNVGWYMDLTANGTGEQTVTWALIVDGMVTFSTNRPIASATTCASPLGEARSYWLNLLNGSGAIGVNGTCGGSRSEVFVGGGIPPSPVSATVNVGGVSQTVVIGAGQRDGASSSALSGQQISLPITNKRTRIYWRNSGDTH